MKILLVLLLVCGLGYVIYTQHIEKEALKTDLTSSREQLDELQKKYDTLQKSIQRHPVAQMGNSTALSSTPQPATQPVTPAPKQSSGSWLNDPNHISPLGTPPPLRRNGH